MERHPPQSVTPRIRRDLVDRAVRLLPIWELVSLGSLTPRDRAALLPAGGSPRGLWLLRARDGAHGTLKVVHASTARLLRRRAAPATPPSDPAAADSLALVLGRLVLDGILEMETASGFVSGPAAYAQVVVNGTRRGRAQCIDRLSAEALRYAANLPPMNPWSLAQRLYAFNSWPVTLGWRQRLPNARALQTWLTLSGSDTARLLRRNWKALAAPPRSGWRAWIPRENALAPPRFKIYVSPVPHALPETFADVVRVLSDFKSAHFKVGRDLAGILRPDKLVIHLESRATMRRVLQALAAQLRGTPAQGVPFTAAGPVASGLLTWGVDPPLREFNLVGRGIESWRGWLVRQLASYLASVAGAPQAGVAAWQFARDRLALDGVDTTHWLPQDLPGAR